MTEGFLLDTSVASAAWDVRHRSHAEISRWLEGIGEAPVWVSPISLGELEYGIALMTEAGDAADLMRAAMREYMRAELDHHVAETYGRLRGRLFNRFAPKNLRGLPKKKRPEDLRDLATSKQLGIQENDLWIVSTAVTRRLTLVSTDAMPHLLEVARDEFGWEDLNHV